MGRKYPDFVHALTEAHGLQGFGRQSETLAGQLLVEQALITGSISQSKSPPRVEASAEKPGKL
eukprot:1140979-Pelagomonas_calceolata.AAC.1